MKEGGAMFSENWKLSRHFKLPPLQLELSSVHTNRVSLYNFQGMSHCPVKANIASASNSLYEKNDGLFLANLY
jgi:hypothetical protein